jgi:transposase
MLRVDTIPNRKSKPTVLLREHRREGTKIRKITLFNLTHWEPAQVEALRLSLAGKTLVPIEEALSFPRSLPHGHVEAILAAVGRLGLERLLDSRPSRQRDLVVAMIADRLIHSASKLATTRLWRDSTLADQLGVADADEDELYDALDWLLERQERIEKKLAKRHLKEGDLVLYDVSSSYYEGHTCPLVAFGHSRDGKKGLPIVVYGAMTNAEGCPVAIDVYRGNTADPTTVPDQVDKLRERFGLGRVVLVGDRGMLTSAQIEALRVHPGLGWISALRSKDIRALVESGNIQLSLFDQQNLAEIESPDYPGERLVVCFNPLLAEDRRRTRDELLEATEKGLDKIVGEVARRTQTPLTAAEIGGKAERILAVHKMRKHFKLVMEDGRFSYERNAESIRREEALDGFYVIRTSESRETMTAADAVRNYKRLAEAERVFRTLKSLDIRIRPIRHRTENHVRAHIFLCLLTYYVEWHMRRALAPMLFDDEERETSRMERDPVAPARPSASADAKRRSRESNDGLELHSFETLLVHLGTRCQIRCVFHKAPGAPTAVRLTDPTPLQEKALKLIGTIVPSS